ncbi:hypothetical protein BCR33DRAFT_721920 [Rhizoclosmatium globosum]|uniref:Uncharacterized protein n=1 Tax=Rhizoclosmatium globosum TaxID=329046 RepID=A0A1Y2BPM7_9FUNG|nr:hypothetical protein BCR33DRAFT_721920 [Rhizoclosmatium globosum]|eukprot:ORY36703.1 hypothetical protein BCR33DRAFT_721920 [Rhizoclosmatium globosum]
MAGTIPLWLYVAVMLATGSMNTILNKWQDMQCVRNCTDPDPSTHKHYEQPVWQTLTMFVGEVGCLVVFLVSAHFQSKPTDESAPLLEDANEENDGDSEVSELSGWKLLLLWLPTLCDLLATTLMNVGLLFVSASIYQMVFYIYCALLMANVLVAKGSVVLFTGTFSTLFLGRQHPPYRWFALCTVFVGVALVGASSIYASKPSNMSLLQHITPTSTAEASTALFGVFLVVAAQSLTASQFVIEEKVLSNYRIQALKAVGLEGFFGLLTGLIVLPPVYYFYGQYQSPDNFFNVVQGFHDTFDVPSVFYTGIGICFSISLFNWSGLSVTQTVSATSRSTIDTCRTVFIWMISMGLGWESFKLLQVIGFVVLIYGTFVFNDVIALPEVLGLGRAEDSEVVVEDDEI